MGSQISTEGVVNPLDKDKPAEVVRHERLSHLNWAVFNDISEIEVYEIANDPTSAREPFAGHPIADEPVTNYDLTEMWVGIHALSLDAFNSDGKREDPKILIKRMDGKPITIGDFVMQVHPFLNTYKTAIMEVEEMSVGKKLLEGTKMIYRTCLSPKPGEINGPDAQVQFFVDLDQE